MIGRQDELDQVQAAIRDGGSVMIAGEAGIGKTRLATAAVEAFACDGWQTEWAVASVSAATVPFGALAGVVPPTAASGDRSALLQAMVVALQERRTAGGLLVAVDDAHLLDDASATLLGLLAAAGTPLLVTVRSRVATPDSIARLSRIDRNRRVDLQALSPIETATVLEVALDGQVDQATAWRLSNMAAGNMLYLRELVVGGLTTGVLNHAYGVWRWRGPLEPNPGLAELVAGHLAGLDDGERRALEVIAIGEPLAAQLLPSLTDLTILESLEQRGLVAAFPQGVTRLVATGHPLYGEVIRAELPAFRADQVRLALATALEATEQASDDDILRTARWRLESGQPPDVTTLLRAARRLLALTDPQGAEQLARTALRLGGGLDGQWLLGHALHRQGRAEEAIAVLEPLTGRSDGAIVDIATSLAELYYFHRGDRDRAEATLADAERRVASTAARHHLRASRAVGAMVEGRLAETVELCAPLLGADAEDGVRLRAVLASVGALSLSGELTRAIAEADRGSDLAVRCAAEMPWAAPQLAAARSVALLAAGEMGEMMSESRRGYERALSDHDEEARAIFGFALGRGFLHQGRVISAARHLQESTALNREHGFIFLRSGLLYLAFALAMTGDQQGAEAALHEAQRHRGGVPVLYESEHLRARACVLASAGETSAAQRAALDAATAATGGQAWTLALWALHDAARWGAAKTTAPRLARVAEHVDGPLVPLMLEHTRAVASDDAVALARVSAGFEMVGFQLYAAEAAAQAARTCARQGRNPLALAAGRRHQALADLCEGAITPALRASVSHGLTPREEEIAILAARGLSDNDIADKLVLSVRTVHSHLRNIYMKLEVSGRRGLQDYLTP